MGEGGKRKIDGGDEGEKEAEKEQQIEQIQDTGTTCV